MSNFSSLDKVFKTYKFPTIAKLKFLFGLLKVRFAYLLLYADTSVPKLWFTLFEIVYAINLMANDPHRHGLGWGELQELIPLQIVGVALLISALCSFYSVIFRANNRILYLLDDLLGVFIWGCIASTYSWTLRELDVTCVAATLSLWFLIRYEAPASKEFTQTMIMNRTRKQKK